MHADDEPAAPTGGPTLADARRSARLPSTDQERSAYVTPLPYGRGRSETRARRILLVLLGAMIALVVASRPAAAHTELISTTPGDQQTVSRAPGVVVLTFDESVVAMGAQVVVTGPQGPVQLGAPEVTEATVSQNLQGGSPAGQYTVAWRVTAADGHPLSGTFGFTAEAAGDDKPATPAAIEAGGPDDASSTGMSIWIWILGGVALVAVVAGVRRQLTRRTDLSPPS